MKSERFYTVLGVFLIVGFILSFSLIFYFFVQEQQKKAETFVLFFDDSLKGLEAGSHVTFRGVKIGQITQIKLTEGNIKGSVIIPVYVDFFVEHSLRSQTSPIENLIKDGWSADISKPNLLTGVADIEIVRSPGSFKFNKKTFKGYPLFPTVKISHQEHSLEETLASAKTLFNNLKKILGSNEMQQTIQSFNAMSRSIDKLATTLNRQVPSVVAYLNRALNEVSQAAFSTKNVAGYLSRHPESLIRGKRAH